MCKICRYRYAKKGKKKKTIIGTVLRANGSTNFRGERESEVEELRKTEVQDRAYCAMDAKEGCNLVGKKLIEKWNIFASEGVEKSPSPRVSQHSITHIIVIVTIRERDEYSKLPD